MNKRTNLKTWVAMSVFLLATGTTAAGEIIFVDANAPGPTHDGSSWANAYNYLQDALADAGSAVNPVEIRVAKGTYKPDQSSAHPNGSGDRTATFRLIIIIGVTIKGGYAGFGEPDPNARDIGAYETILSGDLSGDDNAVVDACDLLSEPTRSENSYHVVTAIIAYQTAVLDGFTITAGNANGPSNIVGSDRGGGMRGLWSAPTVTDCTFVSNSAEYGGGGIHKDGGNLMNCTFRGNAAGTYGGGIYNDNSSSTLTNCTFIGNYSSSGGGIFNRDCNGLILDGCRFNANSAHGGGGVKNFKSSPILINCTFNHNLVHGNGGGMSNNMSNPTLTSCSFTGNIADWFLAKGGGIYSYISTPTINKCTFSGNWAYYAGGGIFNTNCYTTLTNCTFMGNSAILGNALGCDSYMQEYPSEVQATSCILWDGSNQIWNNDNSMITVAYSDADCGWPGEGNIDADPCFVEPGYWDANNTLDDVNDDFWVDGDYHLKSAAGRWDPNSESWVYDDVTSPCIDAGNPGCPVGDEPNDANNIRTNMGAYGGTTEASKTPANWRNIADLTNDWTVDFNDLAVFVDYWLDTGECIPSDLNRSQSIDFVDFAIFGQQWSDTFIAGPGIEKD